LADPHQGSILPCLGYLDALKDALKEGGQRDFCRDGKEGLADPRRGSVEPLLKLFEPLKSRLGILIRPYLPSPTRMPYPRQGKDVSNLYIRV